MSTERVVEIHDGHFGEPERLRYDTESSELIYKADRGDGDGGRQTALFRSPRGRYFSVDYWKPEGMRVTTYSCGLGPRREIINHAKMVREWLRSVNAPEEVAERVRQNIPNLPPLGTVIEDA